MSTPNHSGADRSSARARPPIGVSGAIALGVFGVMLLLALVLDDFAIRVILLVAAIAGLQGLWRGLAETVGVLAGLVVSVVLAAPLGRVIEPLFGAMGVGGVLGRLCAFGLVTAIFVGVGALVGRRVVRAAARRVRALDAWDRVLGAGAGSVYGVLLATLLLLVPLALEPIAIAQRGAVHGIDEQGESGDRGDAVGEPNAAAELVLSSAERIKSSALGGTLQSINPVGDIELLNVAADFAAISRDREALDDLLETPVFREIASNQAIIDAMERFKTDPELRELIERREGVNVRSLFALATSPIVTDLIDRSNVVGELRPRVGELVAAIREVRAKLKEREPAASAPASLPAR